MSTFKTSHRVPGPSMIPVTSSILSSFVTTRIPSGGFVLSSLSSFISRRNTAGVTVFFQTNKMLVYRTYFVEYFDTTDHDDETESRRGCVEGVGQVLGAFPFGEFEPLGQTT